MCVLYLLVLLYLSYYNVIFIFYFIRITTYIIILSVKMPNYIPIEIIDNVPASESNKSRIMIPQLVNTTSKLLE